MQLNIKFLNHKSTVFDRAIIWKCLFDVYLMIAGYLLFYSKED